MVGTLRFAHPTIPIQFKQPHRFAIPVILRCALLRASKDDGPPVADSSFEARYARTSG
jgi:hypothetical protein